MGIGGNGMGEFTPHKAIKHINILPEVLLQYVFICKHIDNSSEHFPLIHLPSLQLTLTILAIYTTQERYFKSLHVILVSVTSHNHN